MADAALVLEEVRGVGPATAAALVARFGTLHALALASNEELTEIKGVGPATARAIQQRVAAAIAEESQRDVATEETPDEDAAVVTSTAEEPAAAVTAPTERDEGTAAEPIIAEDELPEVAHHARPAAGAGAAASGDADDALPLRPKGPALPPPSPAAAGDAGPMDTEAMDTDAIDADVIPLHRVREGVEGTAQDLKGAVDAMWGVVTAAVDAGKSELPEVRKELQATVDALLDTARTLVEAARDVGKRT